VKSGRLRSLLFGGSCGKEEQRALIVWRPKKTAVCHTQPLIDLRTEEITPDVELRQC
jgi:hypothetical protein